VTACKSAAWKPHDNFTCATARKSELIEPIANDKQVVRVDPVHSLRLAHSVRKEEGNFRMLLGVVA
jgi:hypothetical protein